MSSPTGGRWIFSADPASGFSGLVLGINNGVAPVFPFPQAGALNIEVFTNTTVSGVPNPDAGFQASMADPLSPTVSPIDSGFLVGTNLRLGSGNYLAVDSVVGSATQSPSKITLGSGNQTVVGAKFDTLVGGSGVQILSALVGNETVLGGTATESIWGGQSDYIVAGIGTGQQIVVTGSGTTVVAGGAGSATISAAAQDTITSLPGSTQNVVIGAGANDLVNLTGNSGLAGVIGSSGDTVTGGSGTTNVEAVAGGMLINVGAAGITNVSGSASLTAGNTINGGAGNFDFNPSLVAGKGDYINLSGSTGTATINAFSSGSTRVAAHDTILATNNADSVFAGDGDRVGTGNGTVVGGVHQWVHADTVAGSAVGFGANDSLAGTSTAHVTVGGFNTTTDFLFYQNETAGATANIIATSQSTVIGGINSSIITLPDGTVMTLVGVTQAQLTPALFKP